MFLERAKQDDVEAGRCRIRRCVDSGLPPGLEIRTARIEGVEATVTLEAGADATRLLQPSGEDGFTWRNRKPDALIDLVETSGHRQPVRWRLTLAASQIGSARVEYVYDSKCPHRSPRTLRCMRICACN
jgi:hypothetical protein